MIPLEHFGVHYPFIWILYQFHDFYFAYTKKEPAPESGPKLVIIHALLQYHPQRGQCNPDHKAGNGPVNPNPLQILSYLILNQRDQ